MLFKLYWNLTAGPPPPDEAITHKEFYCNGVNSDESVFRQQSCVCSKITPTIGGTLSSLAHLDSSLWRPHHVE